MDGAAAADSTTRRSTPSFASSFSITEPPVTAAVADCAAAACVFESRLAPQMPAGPLAANPGGRWSRRTGGGPNVPAYQALRPRAGVVAVTSRLTVSDAAAESG